MAKERNSFALAVTDLRSELAASEKRAAKNARPSVQQDINKIDPGSDPVRQILKNNNIALKHLRQKEL